MPGWKHPGITRPKRMARSPDRGPRATLFLVHLPVHGQVLGFKELVDPFVPTLASNP